MFPKYFVNGGSCHYLISCDSCQQRQGHGGLFSKNSHLHSQLCIMILTTVCNKFRRGNQNKNHQRACLIKANGELSRKVASISRSQKHHHHDHTKHRHPTSPRLPDSKSKLILSARKTRRIIHSRRKNVRQSRRRTRILRCCGDHNR